MKKTIMVLGASGFIGRNLIDYVKDQNLLEEFEFILISRSNFVGEIKGMNHYALDLTNTASLGELLITTRPNYIINLAGVIIEDLDSSIALNADLPKKIIEIIISNKLPIDNLLLIGSAAEYGGNNNVPLKEDDDLKPLNAYGLSKVIQTDFFKFYSTKLNINLARTFNIIGPYMSTKLSIGSFIEKINNCNDGDYINTGNLSSKRDYLYIDDVINAFFKILISGTPGEIYNVCSGTGISMNSIVEDLIAASGKKVKIKIEPSLVRKIDIPVSFGNNEKLVKNIEWIPNTNIKDILHKLFIKNNIKLEQGIDKLSPPKQ